MDRKGVAALAVLASLPLAACGRLGFDDGPRPARYAPLPAAPTKPVTQGELQPLPPVPGQEPVTQGGLPPPDMPAAPGAPPPAVAAVDTTAEKAVTVGRTDLLGGWKISSGGDSCQLFMTLTTWSGGYRATTRGCNSAQLQKISAWDLQGKQVTLKGADGAVVATLFGAGGERFNGSTSERQGVSLAR